MDRHLHQLHVWVPEEDYRALKQFAAAADESLGRLVRRHLRSLIRSRVVTSVGTTAPREPVHAPVSPIDRASRLNALGR